MIQKTDVDTTIAEIHGTRERLAAKFGGDIDAILEDARKRQDQSGHPIWCRTPKKSTSNTSNADATRDQNPHSFID